MADERRQSLLVGAFAVVALSALALAILTLSSESGLFEQRYRLVARFDNVQGLKAGAPVWLAGKEVGTVSDVRFAPLGEEKPLRVTLGLVDSVREMVREGSLASIGTIGVLGDSYIELTVGPVDGRILADGDEIASESPSNLGQVIAKGTRALDHVAELAGNLNEVVASFSGEDGGERMAKALQAVSDIMIELREGKGLLHAVIYEEYTGEEVAGLTRSLDAVESILLEVRDGDGFLHDLVYGGSDDQALVSSVVKTSDRVGRVLDKLESGEGTLGLLLNDPGLYRDVEALLERVEAGEGTLGLLVNDPTLYEDVRKLLTGAQRSTVLRTLIRRAVEGGEGE